jgi:hypothetical protein
MIQPGKRTYLKEDSMEKRYRALRIVGSLYKIIGFIVLILAIIGAIGICAAGTLGGAFLRDFSNDFGPGMMNGMGSTFGGVIGGIISGLVFLIGGGIGGLTLYATGEAIYLLIDIEENTRIAAGRVVQPVTVANPPA